MNQPVLDRKRINRLLAIEASLPRCRPWIGGSGGHKKFGTCDHIATWTDYGDPEVSSVEWYCDEHYTPEMRELSLCEETPWAQAVRS